MEVLFASTSVSAHTQHGNMIVIGGTFPNFTATLYPNIIRGSAIRSSNLCSFAPCFYTQPMTHSPDKKMHHIVTHYIFW
jgi:hypothetical protein